MAYNNGGSVAGKAVGIGALILIVIAVIGVATVFLGSWYTIDQRERGVILRNGKLIGVATPGLNFKVPLIDSVVKLNLETHRVTVDKVNAYSRDQQPADFKISVNFRVPEDKVDELYTNYGSLNAYADRILIPRVNADSKIVFGQFNAATAIQERQRLLSEIDRVIKQNVGSGTIVVESVQVENIDFSDAYEKSIEQRMLAEVEVQRLRQNAEREKVQADIKVTQANAEADATRARAKAEAEAITLRGNAEADAIKARGAALNQNPSLISLVQAEKWDGKLPTSMPPNSTVPFLNVK